MYMNRSISRVLAAAVASAGFAVPVPTIGASLSCTAASFTATSDGSGNINVSCTQAGTTSGGTCSISASPSVLSASGGTVTRLDQLRRQHVAFRWQVGRPERLQQLDRHIGANSLSTTVSYTYTVSGDGGSKSVTVSQSGTGGGTTPAARRSDQLRWVLEDARPRHRMGCAFDSGSARADQQQRRIQRR